MVNFVVDDKSAGERADIFVARQYPQFTRSSLERLFDSGYVSIDKSPVKASRRLVANQKVEVKDDLLKLKPANINLPIVYEDQDVIVIDKPAGVLTHSKGSLNLEPTVASFILPKLDKSLGGNRAGIVHRLDRATSGLIIAANNTVAMTYLQRQFSNHKVDKTYLAIVKGTPKQKEAIINAPIQRNPNKPQTFRVNNQGKPAQTEYRLIKRLDDSRSLLELRPKTGRTHQIRVHLAYIDHPVLGDPIYGQDGSRLMLHAWKLKISLPSGKTEQFVAQPPDDFKLIANL